MNTPVIAIHGGSGTVEKSKITAEQDEAYRNGLKKALQAGIHILQKHGSSLDAVEAAVCSLEDNPLFNAGKGSVLNELGKAEMDAAIMCGRTKAAGAVASVSAAKNPIKVARMVMDDGKFVLLCGEGADQFIREHGLDTESGDYFITDARLEEWHQKNEKQKKPVRKMGTVGAVALDMDGDLAAATSTGGLTNKARGRVSDSALIGAGTYAENGCCAVSCTGEGERFIKAVAAYQVACRIRFQQLSLIDAAGKTILSLPSDSGGLIAIDSNGNVAMPFNTEGMYRAAMFKNGEIQVDIF